MPASRPNPVQDTESYERAAGTSPPAPRRLGLAPKRVGDVRSALIASGGVAAHADLVADTSRRAVEAAVAAGLVVRPMRGMYALAETPSNAIPADADAAARAAARAERVGAHRRCAKQFRATLSHRSAAQFHGLDLLEDPPKPEVIVVKGRAIEPLLARTAQVRRRTLQPHEHADGVTSVLRTVLDCAADLPFAEALAIADSALRETYDHPAAVGPSELALGADTSPTRVRAAVRRVVEHADGRAANAFESALRAIALQVDGLSVVPQVGISTTFGHPAEVARTPDQDSPDEGFCVDLADRRLGIVLEADSFAWHGSKAAFDADCWRYTCLVADGWLVLRFTWQAVTQRAAEVRALLEHLVELRARELSCSECGHSATRGERFGGR